MVRINIKLIKVHLNIYLTGIFQISQAREMPRVKIPEPRIKRPSHVKKDEYGWKDYLFILTYRYHWIRNRYAVYFVSSIHQIQRVFERKERRNRKNRQNSLPHVFLTQDHYTSGLFDSTPRSHSSDIPTLSYNLVPPHYNPPVPSQ